MNVRTGGTKKCSSLSMDINDRVVSGLRCFVCEKGVTLCKILRPSQGRREVVRTLSKLGSGDWVASANI